jgi:hypothetical protein
MRADDDSGVAACDSDSSGVIDIVKVYESRSN